MMLDDALRYVIGKEKELRSKDLLEKSEVNLLDIFSRTRLLLEVSAGVTTAKISEEKARDYKKNQNLTNGFNNMIRSTLEAIQPLIKELREEGKPQFQAPLNLVEGILGIKP